MVGILFMSVGPYLIFAAVYDTLPDNQITGTFNFVIKKPVVLLLIILNTAIIVTTEFIWKMCQIELAPLVADYFRYLIKNDEAEVEDMFLNVDSRTLNSNLKKNQISYEYLNKIEESKHSSNKVYVSKKSDMDMYNVD